MKQIYMTDTPGECKFYLEWDRPVASPEWVQLLCAFHSDQRSFSLSGAIRESLKTGLPCYKTTFKLWPRGTIIGVKTMGMGEGFVKSLEPLEAPPLDIYPKVYGVLPGFSKEVLWDATNHKAANGYLEQYIEGVVYAIYSWHVTPEPSAPDDMAQADIGWVRESSLMGTPKVDWFVEDCPSMYLVPRPWFLRVFADYNSVPVLPTPPLHWHLYHGTKISSEITPPHGTVLFDGSYQTIEAYPLNDRTLTSFKVQGVEQLPGAAEKVVLDPKITITPTPIPDPAGLARMVYGPVHSDVYVDAIAIGVTIDETLTAGLEKTFQMTTTDCFVEADSWSLGATDMPAEITRSISPTGLVSIFVPEEIYDGSPEATYYQDVEFRGYSQTKTLRLIFTVEPVPAFGTVWTAVTKLSESVRDIFYASNGSVLIATTTKVFVTTNLVDFTELTNAGTVTVSFNAITEISGGRIVVCDKTAIWTHDLGSPALTKQNYSVLSSGGSTSRVIGDITGDKVAFVSASALSRYYRCQVWDVTMGAAVGGNTALGPTDEVAASACPKPVLANDGSWVFINAMAGCYSLARYALGAVTVVKPKETAIGTPTMWKESNGRIFVVGARSTSPNTLFVRYSDDHGVTWTDETIIAADGNSTLFASIGLRQNYAIFSQTYQVKRTTDGMLTFTTPQGLNGTISSFAMIGERKLLAGTDGATTNLYKSEA